MEESESRDRHDAESRIDFQGRKEQLKGTSVSIREKKKGKKKTTTKPNHITDDFRNNMRAKEIAREGRNLMARDLPGP